MAYTFLDQQNFLSSLLGDPNTSSEDMWPASQRLSELNNGELQFARDAKNLREYATGSVSNNEIAVPSDWLGTYVLIIDDKVITNDREIALQDWERYYTHTGAPPYYYFWEFSGTRYIKLLGSATTYKIYYWKRPTTTLVNNTDTSIHPEEYRKAPVYFAAAELMKQIGKHQESQLMYQYYQEYIIRANTDIGKTYINKEYARPDFGEGNSSTSDTQGRDYFPYY
jgi:hypothetical protein